MNSKSVIKDILDQIKGKSWMKDVKFTDEEQRIFNEVDESLRELRGKYKRYDIDSKSFIDQYYLKIRAVKEKYGKLDPYYEILYPGLREEYLKKFL